MRFDPGMYLRLPRPDPRLDEPLRLLGTAFADLRRNRGLSQRAMAEIIGVSQSSISRFEAGKAPWF